MEDALTTPNLNKPPDGQAPKKLTFVIVDDHDSVLAGTCQTLQGQYPEVELITARTAEDAERIIENNQPELLVMDLSLPTRIGEGAKPERGIQLLRTILGTYPHLNIVVQSAHLEALARLKSTISAHQAGFTVADKSLTKDEMLVKVDWSLNGLLYTSPEMRIGLEIKPEWLTLLQLACEEALTDKVIAQRMNISARTVRHYWTRVQNALEVYPQEGVNIRIQTCNHARQAGLLD